MTASDALTARAPAGLRDRRGRMLRDLRISVMDRCNFRCPYCMPRETFHETYRFLGSHERLSFDEIVRVTRLLVRLGVRKLRLTGGEPLLRLNLTDLIGDLTAIEGVDEETAAQMIELGRKHEQVDEVEESDEDSEESEDSDDESEEEDNEDEDSGDEASDEEKAEASVE